MNKLVHHSDDIETLKFQGNTLVTGSDVSAGCVKLEVCTMYICDYCVNGNFVRIPLFSIK